MELIDRTFRFRSRPSVGESYLIEVGVDSYGVVTIRSVVSERGAQGVCRGELPALVGADLATATDMARVLAQTYRVWSGQVVFRGEPQMEIGIAGKVATSFYLVFCTAQNGVSVVGYDRTVDSFKIRPIVPLGTIDNPVPVNVEVVVPAVLAAPLAGELEFFPGEWVKRVVLTPMMIPPDAYRVVVDPVGGFPVRAENFFDYFDVTIGAGVPKGSSRRVRYAVVLR